MKNQKEYIGDDSFCANGGIPYVEDLDYLQEDQPKKKGKLKAIRHSIKEKLNLLKIPFKN